MIAVDTSVVVAALSPWHESHDVAGDTCRQQAWVPAHCLLEAYSTLTRLPEPLRVSGAMASEVLARAWGNRVITPSPQLSEKIVNLLARAQVVGGSSYDGLVALTAHEHGAQLVSLDRRAERTYRLLGVAYRIIV